jgi:cell division protein FtsQ
MHTPTKVLKKPLSFKKKWFIQFGLFIVMVGFVLGLYSFYKANAYEVREFIATKIDATLEIVLVSGTTHLPTQTLLQTFPLKKGDSLVGFESAALREKLQELDWVKEAVVERELPSTVKISIYEYKPLARLNDEQGLFIVDNTGHKITAIEEDSFKHLPLLRGEQSAENAAELFGLLMQKEIKLGADVVEARFIGERRWDIGFGTDVWVNLPENNAEKALDILKKLNAAKKVLTMEGTVIDLRLEDRIVLRLPEDKKIEERVL